MEVNAVGVTGSFSEERSTTLPSEAQRRTDISIPPLCARNTAPSIDTRSDGNAARTLPLSLMRAPAAREYEQTHFRTLLSVRAFSGLALPIFVKLNQIDADARGQVLNVGHNNRLGPTGRLID